MAKEKSGGVRKQAEAPHQKQSPIVGIGASAGGIRPLQTFFENLPGDLGLTYVVILHLAPEVRSELPSIWPPTQRCR